MKHLKLKLWTFPLKLSLISNAYSNASSHGAKAMKWAKLYLRSTLVNFGH